MTPNTLAELCTQTRTGKQTLQTKSDCEWPDVYYFFKSLIKYEFTNVLTKNRKFVNTNIKINVDFILTGK